MRAFQAIFTLLFMGILIMFNNIYEYCKSSKSKQEENNKNGKNNVIQLVFTSIVCSAFIACAGGSASVNNVLFGFLMLGAYICSLAFVIFAFTGKEKNGCLLAIFGFTPILIVLAVFPISIPVVMFFVNKLEKSEKENQLDCILQKCKQDGSLDDIENLKALVEQNIKTNGSSIEFLELNFAIAKLYNIRVETEKANEYFNKVKNIISRLNYEDICLLAKKSIDNKDFHDAVFYYTYIMLYNKVKDNKEIPDIYYNRAIAYQGLNQVSYKDKAIEDLKTAITKTKEISDTLSYMEVETFLEGKLDKYNFKIGEIYQDLKEYDKAIKYYNQVSKNCTFFDDVQEQIKLCESLQLNKEKELKEQAELLKIKKAKELAQNYFKLGLKKSKEYDFDGAIEYFNQAISADSKNAEYYYQKGLLYKQNYNTNKAKEELSKAIELEPDNSLYYFTRAEIHYFQNHNAAAVNDYEKGYELNTNPSNDILNHMENCLSLFIHNGRPKAKHYYLHAQLLINEKDAKDYTYKVAINELNKAIKKDSLYEYYVLRVYTRCKYLLMTKDKAFLDSEFECLIKDLLKIREKNENNNEPCEFLKSNYPQLLAWAKRKGINQGLISRLEKLDNEIKDEIEVNKVNAAWLMINNYKEQETNQKELAESYYIVANNYYNKKQVSKSKYYINKAIEIINSKKYAMLLDKISKKENEKWDKKVAQGEKYIITKNLDKAFLLFQELSQIKPDLQDIKDKLTYINDLQNKSEQYYKQGLNDFEKGDVDNAKKQIDSAIEINNLQEYLNLHTNILKLEKCLVESNKHNYQEAYFLIKELANLFPENKIFSELTKNITDKLVNYLYKCSLDNINDGKYDIAISGIQQALEIYPDNEEYKEILEKANNRIVDIKTCNKDAILTLDGFNEEKAEQFINDRKFMNWYDIESFANHFNLQPHEMVMLEDRLIFPLKPQVKKGRPVDI